MQFGHRDNEVELTTYSRPSKFSWTIRTASSVEPAQKPRYNGSRHTWKFWKWEIATVLVAIAVMVAIFVTLHKFDKHPTSEWAFGLNLNTLVALLATILRAALMYPAAQIISQEKWFWFASSPKRLSDLDAFEDGSRGPWGALLLFPLVVRHRPLTVLAIFILILSLGIGSFVQQATKTIACETQFDAGDVFIPVIQNLTIISGKSTLSSQGTFEGSIGETRMAFENSVSFFRPNGDDSVVLSSCSAPVCRFPEWGYLDTSRPGWMVTDKARELPVTHASMGMCSSCVDVSSTATGTIKTQNGHSTAHISLPLVFTESGDKNFTSRGLTIDVINRGDNRTRGFTILDVEQLNFMYRPRGQNLDLKWLMDALDQETGHNGIGALITNASIGFVKIMAMSTAPCSLNPQKGQSRCLPENIQDHLRNLAVKAPADTGFAASTCVLYPCLRSYNGKVANGALNQTLLGVGVAEIVKERHDPSRDAQTAAFGIIHTPCRVSEQNYGAGNISSAAGGKPELPMTLMRSGTVLSDYPKECVYTMTDTFEQKTNDDNVLRLNGTCDATADIRCFEHEPLISLVGSNLNATHDSIAAHMSSYTLSVSNKLRREETVRSEARGIALKPDVCFVFEWDWLMFPAALTLLTTVLLLTTILTFNSGDEVPVWKDSLLPLILHGDRFDGLGTKTQAESGHATGALLDINDLEQRANTLHVKLNGRRKGSHREDSDRNSLLVHN
ncbi:hypothetical protein QBC44DRAFT_360587 [Cladorrhinum sp. PSN332]|nr:hypothetical protein QBC44DRAFT_360587 [Cladorrhinum sp. PSN332]